MKLISCDIENFGCLSNFHMDFTDGLNIICRENGFGKSTLAAFIRVMFYGFENQTKRDAYTNERLKYKPWQGGVYGGRIKFLLDDITYVMSKTFGTKESEDVIYVRTADNDIEATDFKLNPGEDIFKLDSQSFRRTVYLSQNDCDYAMTDGINAKLSNMTDNMDDINNYEKVDEKLKKMLNSMTPDRVTGSLHNDRTRIETIRNDLRRLPNLEKSITEYDNLVKSEEAKELANDDELNALQQRIIELNSKISTLKERSNIHKLSDEEAELFDKLSVSYKNTGVSDDKIDAVWDYKKLEKKIDSRQKNLELMEANYELMKSQKSTAKYKTVMSVLAAFMGGFAIVMFWIKREIGIISAIMASLLIVAMLIMNAKKKTVVSEPNELADLRSELSNLKKELEAKDTNSCEELFLRINKCKDDIECQEVLNSIKEELKQYKRLQQKYNDYQSFLKLNDTSLYIDELNGVNQKIKELKQQNKLISNNISKYNNTIAELKNDYDELTANGEQLELLLEQYEADCDKYRLLTITRKLLSEAKISFGQKYIRPVRDGFDKYFNILKGIQKDFIVNAAGELRLSVSGIPRDRKFLSAGLKDLTGICMRMSLIDAMYQHNRPFIIFDDPFVNLDDDNTDGGIKLLSKISEEYQVIYFTCHNSRARI